MLLLFHLSVVLINAYTLWYDQNYITLDPKHQSQLGVLPFKGRVLFLTMWCLVTQTIYFTMALLNDLIGTNAPAPKKPPVIRIFKDALFSLAFPAALFVGIAFWSIFSYDSELIFPEHIRTIFPVWANHVMHTTIVPFIILELFLSSITYPSRKVGLTIGVIFVFSYVSVLATMFFKTGTLIYPVFKVMPAPMKLAFIVGGAIFGLFLYFLGEFLNYLVSPKAKESTASSSKTSGKKKAKKA